MSARILCVEDNGPNMALMSYLLSARGHDPVPALDGPSALALVATHDFDLVLLDIQLPGMSGHDVLAALRNKARAESFPVIAVTAFAMVGDREKILASGFDGYISKPIEPQTFVDQVEAHLPPDKLGRRTVVPTPEAADRPKVNPELQRSRTVLVVDDHVENIELTRNTLEPFGYEVYGASSVEDGWSLVRSRVPDVLLCDVHMPGGDGLKLVSLVRAEERLSHVQIGVITWTAGSAHWERLAKEAGADFFLRRPVEPSVLLSLLADALPPGKA